MEAKSKDMMSQTGHSMMLDSCPPLRHIVPSVSKYYKNLVQQYTGFYELFKGLTEQRKQDYDEKNPKIYIDHFLSMIGKNVKVGPAESDVYTVEEKDVVAMGAVIVVTGEWLPSKH